MLLKIFLIETVPGAGFAEWWDSSLNEGNDLLRLFINADSMYENDLLYTIQHEVYPGHGHFYHMSKGSGSPVFDHGAMTLVEGWATYAEWHAQPSSYTEATRHNALLLLQDTIHLSGSERAATVLTHKREQGYSAEEGLRTLEYVSQYIGFLESYYWGALWFEQVFDKLSIITPAAFLRQEYQINFVEGFGAWQFESTFT